MPKPSPTCYHCGALADLLCDYIIAIECTGIERPKDGRPYRCMGIGSRSFTCDRHLCEACTTKGRALFVDGASSYVHVDDLCREHADGQQNFPPILTKREADALRRRNEMRLYQPNGG